MLPHARGDRTPGQQPCGRLLSPCARRTSLSPRACAPPAMVHSDVIIVLLHGGPPEDAALASAVPDIDVIVAGHTHDEYHRTTRDGVRTRRGLEPSSNLPRTFLEPSLALSLAVES